MTTHTLLLTAKSLQELGDVGDVLPANGARLVWFTGSMTSDLGGAYFTMKISEENQLEIKVRNNDIEYLQGFGLSDNYQDVVTITGLVDRKGRPFKKDFKVQVDFK
ncbi:hypothetical protein J31TS6_62320 [Brevibacillus reuszeri]|uniref:hypothetical protein n=1 Tax=Brevibacillus reuszeri TaxID=54915 RepID=UPI001B19107E|nr:hypothetical protein [Brevibacillus reuszeri]GIO10204.1 hypothetical protein J31TS6_62320 [Brevibacillus reuszeri]